MKTLAEEAATMKYFLTYHRSTRYSVTYEMNKTNSEGVYDVGVGWQGGEQISAWFYIENQDGMRFKVTVEALDKKDKL